ncbi:hypothetical protein Alo02nite_26440 [Actinoplanes lobatus]|nr:hypothetical protein Alo02nite_26440 [Actinoplanes lobatus]
MVEVLGRYRLSTGGSPRVAKHLDEGGEGWVYALHSPARSALKIYKDDVLAKRGPELSNKLARMVARPPVDPTAGTGHTTLAWPTAVVSTGSGAFQGFVMPLLDLAHSVPLHQVVNPGDRSDPLPDTPAWVPAFGNWRRLTRVAANLAGATHALHTAGYVIGDFNESNILVSDRALVTLIDCDSMQVPSGTGTPYLCRVGKEDYTPPEDGDYSRPRTVHSDTFALAVHVFMLLMEGRHPFSGRWAGAGDKPSRRGLAKRGLYFLAGDPQLTPPVGTPPEKLLPADIRALFRRAFIEGARDPARRPTAEEWQVALDRLNGGLRDCAADPGHAHPKELLTCPWCELDRVKASRAAATRSTSTQKPMDPARPSHSSGARPGVTRYRPVTPPPFSPPAPPPFRPPAPSRPVWQRTSYAEKSVLALGIGGIISITFCTPLALILGLIAASRAKSAGQSPILGRIAWMGGIAVAVLKMLVSTSG